MKAKIENDTLTLEVQLDPNAPDSASGKSLLLVNTRGLIKTQLVHNGNTVQLSLIVIGVKPKAARTTRSVSVEDYV